MPENIALPDKGKQQLLVSMDKQTLLPVISCCEKCPFIGGRQANCLIIKSMFGKHTEKK